MMIEIFGRSIQINYTRVQFVLLINNRCVWYEQLYLKLFSLIVNRPGVAGAVLQIPLLLIDWLSESAFSSKSLQHHKSQTVKARKLKFWENVHPPPCVTCQVSRVRCTCQVSGVTCQVSRVWCQLSGVICRMLHFFFFFTKWWN